MPYSVSGYVHRSPGWVVNLNMDDNGNVSGTCSPAESFGFFCYKSLELYGIVENASGQVISSKKIGGISGGGNNIYAAFNISEHMDGVPGGAVFKIYTTCQAGESNNCICAGERWNSWPAPGHYTGLYISLAAAVPPPPPPPVVTKVPIYLENSNLFGTETGTDPDPDASIGQTSTTTVYISNSSTSVTVRAYVPSSTASQNRPWAYFIWKSGQDYQENGYIWDGTWREASLTFLGMNPGDKIKVWAVALNDAGVSEPHAGITCRTRKEGCSITVTIQSVTMETVTFKWTSNKYLERVYWDDGSSYPNLGPGSSGTYTAKWFNPDSDVTIRVVGYVESGDAETGGSGSATAHTLKAAAITSCSGVFGNPLKINYTKPTGYGVMFTIYAINTEGTKSSTITVGSQSSQITDASSYDVTFTQAQLDSIYRTYLNNTNNTTLKITISTFGDSSRPGGPKKYTSAEFTYTLVLTGIAKTAHIAPLDDGVPHRCQVWYAPEAGPAKRAVMFWGDTNGKGRRTI